MLELPWDVVGGGVCVALGVGLALGGVVFGRRELLDVVEKVRNGLWRSTRWSGRGALEKSE